LAEEQRQWPRVDRHLDITLKPGVGTTDLEGVTPLGAAGDSSCVQEFQSFWPLHQNQPKISKEKRPTFYLTIDTPIEAHPIELEI
jgi:hypothetical protein